MTMVYIHQCRERKCQIIPDINLFTSQYSCFLVCLFPLSSKQCIACSRKVDQILRRWQTASLKSLECGLNPCKSVCSFLKVWWQKYRFPKQQCNIARTLLTEQCSPLTTLSKGQSPIDSSLNTDAVRCEHGGLQGYRGSL